MVTEGKAQHVIRRRAETGVVTSAAGDKTIRVMVENLVKHATYGKYVRRHSKLAVHDPRNDAKVGDVVEVLPCRRMSKTKSWRLVRIVRRADRTAEAAGKEE